MPRKLAAEQNLNDDVHETLDSHSFQIL